MRQPNAYSIIPHYILPRFSNLYPHRNQRISMMLPLYPHDIATQIRWDPLKFPLSPHPISTIQVPIQFPIKVPWNLHEIPIKPAKFLWNAHEIPWNVHKHPVAPNTLAIERGTLAKWASNRHHLPSAKWLSWLPTLAALTSHLRWCLPTSLHNVHQFIPYEIMKIPKIPMFFLIKKCSKSHENIWKCFFFF
jgi:hypothetical protein